MIFINKIKAIVKKYFKYLTSYKTENIVLFIILNGFLLTSLYYYDGLLEGAIFSFLLLPIFMVHLITDKNKTNLILSKDDDNINKKKNRVLSSIKYYLFKYLKFYLIFLMIFLILYLFSFLSSIMSLYILLDESPKSIGQSLILMLSVFVLIEGLYTMVCTPSILLYLETESFNPFKAIYMGRKRMKKQLFGHFVNVSAFGLVTIPLVAISDSLVFYPSIAAFFISIYLLNIVNFIIFDLKERFKNTQEVKSK